MNARCDLLRRIFIGGALILLPLVTVAVRAEVGVSLSPGPGEQAGTLYALGITDAPDPILWGRLNLEGSGRYVLNPLGQQNGDGPSVLYDAVSHLAIVAWALNSASGLDVVVGHFWVDWIDASGEMAWTRQDSQGNWGPIRYEASLQP